MITRTALLIAALGLAACKDPSKDTAKATVTEPAKAVAAVAAVEAPSAAGQETLPITSENSKIAFTASKVTGSHEGGFNAFSGSLQLNPAKTEASRLDIDIQMGSVFTDSERLTGHLKTADFFLIEQHPTAKFVSTEIKTGGENGATHTITGNLTLRGVTKTISFPANVTVAANAVTAKAEFALPRLQFGIAYAGKADDLIRDNVIIKLDVTAPRSARAL